MIFSAKIKKINLTDQTGTRTVLQDIQFELNPGEIYTILGKNGSGKSTLIKSLTKLLDLRMYSTEGSVFWKDENIFLMNEADLLELRRKKIKYVLQDLNFNFDPLKKLKYYFEKSGLNKENISEQLKYYLLPEYEIISGLHSYEISGGMAQRVSLLLALLPNPQLLILDEPTSAVDYTNINLIKIKLKDFAASGGTVLIVTQDVGFAKEVSDKIAFLQNGLLTQFTDNKLFFNNDGESIYSGFLKSFYELQ